jgi:hypothetical protein
VDDDLRRKAALTGGPVVSATTEKGRHARSRELGERLAGLATFGPERETEGQEGNGPRAVRSRPKRRDLLGSAELGQNRRGEEIPFFFFLFQFFKTFSK